MSDPAKKGSSNNRILDRVILTQAACMIMPTPIRYVVLLVLFVASLVLFVLAFIFGGMLVFISRTFLLAVVLVSLPTLVPYFVRSSSNLVKVFILSLSSTLSIVGYAVWILGFDILGLWIWLVFALILVLFIGASILEHQQKNIVKRLSTSSQFPLALSEVRRLERIRERQKYFYAFVPIGLTIAVAYGLAFSLNEVYIMQLEVISTIAVALLILIVMLTSSGMLMSKALILIAKEKERPSFIESKEQFLFANFIKALQFRISSGSDDQKKDSRYGLDAAYLVSDLRRFYFFDSVHNTSLLVGFSIALALTLNIDIVLNNLLAIAVIGFAILFIFCYMPFSIGQYRLHENILEDSSLEGIARKELKDKLVDVSPLYPTSDFFSALLATGTAGGLIAALAYELLQNALN